MHLTEYLESRLERSGLSREALQELLIRLLHYGVLVRNESQVERELYDRFVRVEDIVTEALDLFGIRVYHARRFEYVRLFPPGSRTPESEATEQLTSSGALRARLSQDEVALILVLRAQYDKALREGRIGEGGYVTESFEAVSLAMRNWLNRSLPERATERARVFHRLKRLRLIDFRQDQDVEASEAWLRIHPMIVDFVSGDVLDALRGQAADGHSVDGTDKDDPAMRRLDTEPAEDDDVS
ncbi:MAG TPA: DUF4194 domain-containing protein [Steroidobacteraceae bacterium]